MTKILGLAFAVSLALVPSMAVSAMTMDEAGDKAIGLIEGLANIVDANKTNCDKMGVELNKYEDDNAALIKDLNAMKAKRSEADKKAWNDKYKDRLKAAQQKMMGGGQACEANEKVKTAFGRMR